MKRLLGLLVLVAVLAVAWVAWVNLREDGMQETALPSGATAAEVVARGEYLTRAGNCMTCHTDRGGTPYAGGRPIDTPFGMLYASNLTPDAGTGLGRWSTADFWRAMHHGRSRDGRLLYPAFPYPNYTQVRREDADAMFAYLRTLPPARQPNRPHELRWPYSTQSALAVWRALYFRSGEHRDEPAQSAEWNRGAYLVRGLGHCSACHATRNALGASDMMDLSGGLIPMQGWYAPSLADSQEAGLQRWSTQLAVELLGTGVAEGASVLGPMAEVVLHSTQYLAPQDLQAMAVFLRSLPDDAVQPQARSPAPPPSAAIAEHGARLYGQHCAQCHGEQGRGVAGAYPPLAGNRAVALPVTANLVQVVLYGGFPPATAGHPRPFGMPPYATVLSDADIAAVLTHLRTSWGNAAPPVTELEVAQQRDTRR
ncbi:cytochrome c [Ramlibacter tataouinensis]|uniref:Alcohol dehydrogenase cytochrome c subunit-like protein n=1 Tax=Ramlibacter tataouinensis (strain ATCC BAA-407 / DSM 14655 / LMG 21543 / TTB310) TaxID=365046 RepID=F5Y534_RAMTT|nr:cytochrome c [Ramlibacter tataouinensis]AEG93874.1 alcohol dehydrogenase cytochrome c subunit precursor-like protein [Ramlibacter tataouinensis TTB310]